MGFGPEQSHTRGTMMFAFGGLTMQISHIWYDHTPTTLMSHRGPCFLIPGWLLAAFCCLQVPRGLLFASSVPDCVEGVQVSVSVSVCFGACRCHEGYYGHDCSRLKAGAQARPGAAVRGFYDANNWR